MPTVTIVVPVYNRPEAVAAAIASARAQTFDDWELIVVDDGSTDGTATAVEAAIAGDGRMRLVRLASNRGVSVARNAAIRQARGAWIAILDSDDTWMPEKLAMQLARAKSWESERGAPPGFVYCWADILRRNGRVDRMEARREGMVRDKMLLRFFCHPSTWFVRTDAMRAVGMFDETMRAGEDCDFQLRFSALHEYACVPKALAFVRRDRTDHLTESPEWGEVLMRRYGHEFRRAGGGEHEARFWRGIARMYADQGRFADARRMAIKGVAANPLAPFGWRLLASAIKRGVLARPTR